MTDRSILFLYVVVTGTLCALTYEGGYNNGKINAYQELRVQSENRTARLREMATQLDVMEQNLKDLKAKVKNKMNKAYGK